MLVVEQLVRNNISGEDRTALDEVKAEILSSFSDWHRRVTTGKVRCGLRQVFSFLAAGDHPDCEVTNGQKTDLCRLSIREMAARRGLKGEILVPDMTSRAALEIRDADVMRFAMSRYPEAMAWGTKSLSKVADCRLSSPDVLKAYQDWQAFDQT